MRAKGGMERQKKIFLQEQMEEKLRLSAAALRSRSLSPKRDMMGGVLNSSRGSRGRRASTDGMGGHGDSTASAFTRARAKDIWACLPEQIHAIVSDAAKAAAAAE